MIQAAEFGSKLQIQSVGLRYEVLRRPLGLYFDPADLATEANEVHLVATDGSRVVGVMLLKDLGNGELKMRQVAVVDEMQSMGLGKKMVEFAENFAKENGFEKITLHARISAAGFYTRMQYETISGEFEEVGIPHVKMEKKIR